MFKDLLYRTVWLIAFIALERYRTEQCGTTAYIEKNQINHHFKLIQLSPIWVISILSCLYSDSHTENGTAGRVMIALLLPKCTHWERGSASHCLPSATNTINLTDLPLPRVIDTGAIRLQPASLASKTRTSTTPQNPWNELTRSFVQRAMQVSPARLQFALLEPVLSQCVSSAAGSKLLEKLCRFAMGNQWSLGSVRWEQTLTHPANDHNELELNSAARLDCQAYLYGR